MIDPGFVNVALNIGGLLLGGTALGVVLRYKLGQQKLAADSEADIRDHYADEVKALREKLNLQEQYFRGLETHLRGLIDESDRRHSECEAARVEDRRERSRMQDEIDGMKAQIRAASTDRVLRMEKDPPEAPHSRAAAHRVKGIIENGGK